jgi:hypothetical protein
MEFVLQRKFEDLLHDLKVGLECNVIYSQTLNNLPDVFKGEWRNETVVERQGKYPKTVMVFEKIESKGTVLPTAVSGKDIIRRLYP